MNKKRTISMVLLILAIIGLVLFPLVIKEDSTINQDDLVNSAIFLYY